MEATDCRLRPVLFCLSYSLLSIHVPRTASPSFNLNFSNPSPSCGARINCTGATSVTLSKLELTRKDLAQGGINRASYVQPVPLWDNATGKLANFATTFSLLITPAEAQYIGNGMAFFLTHYLSKIPLNSSGGSLSLLPAYKGGIGDGQIAAVELDTWGNKPPADISGNHIGIDINYIISVESNSTLYQVNATADLRSYLPKEITVGFSAATGLAVELHRILSWSSVPLLH